MQKVREKLNAKLRTSGGFTLIEMLIVVAIIAILIAVSIPLVGNALERAKAATDAANERAAKAAMTIMYLNKTVNPGDTEYTKDTIYCYDASAGKMISAAPNVKYGQCSEHAGEFLSVKYDEDKQEVYMSWGASKADTLTKNGDDLCSADMGTTT